MKVAALVLVVLSLLVTPALAQAPAQPAAPAAEMQRLARLIVGKYKVVETHHARPGSGGKEWVAKGTAKYILGPDGSSVVEQYNSKGPRGDFSAIAVIWWDASLGAFKHLECESGESCGVVEDAGKWEGSAVVFRRQIERQGRKIQAEDRYDFAQPDSIVITSRFSMDGGPMMTAMTITYAREQRAAAQSSLPWYMTVIGG